MGYIEYRCLVVVWEGHLHRVAMSCKSSPCLRCAKVYVDTWVSQVSQMLHEGVIYRHIVLTVPAILRKTFYQQAQAVLSPFMRCGVRCLDEVYTLRCALKGGYIMVIQTHGRNGQYNPHLHIIATSGGWDQQAVSSGAPGRCAVSPVAQAVAVVSAHDVAGQTVKTQEMQRLVDVCYTALSRGLCHQCTKGRCPPCIRVWQGIRPNMS